MSWLSGLFGGKNPANAAMPYLNQIPGQTSPYMQPYFEAGKNSLPHLQEQYGGLTNDPGSMMNKFGESYKQSPGLNFAIQQAMQGGNHAAAAGGMAGSPEHEQQNMQMANDMASQDYNNWMKNALGMYGQGLEGEQKMAGMGQQSGQDLASMIANTLQQKAGYGYAGQAAQNQQKSGLFGNIASAAGTALGGPMGGAFSNWLFGSGGGQ